MECGIKGSINKRNKTKTMKQCRKDIMREVHNRAIKNTTKKDVTHLYGIYVYHVAAKNIMVSKTDERLGFFRARNIVHNPIVKNKSATLDSNANRLSTILHGENATSIDANNDSICPLSNERRSPYITNTRREPAKAEGNRVEKLLRSNIEINKVRM